MTTPELILNVRMIRGGMLLTNKTVTGLTAKHVLQDLVRRMSAMGSISLRADQTMRLPNPAGNTELWITSNYDVVKTTTGSLLITRAGQPCPCGATHKAASQ